MPTRRTLQERRERLGLTQDDVAGRAKCSVQYVRMIEAGYAPRSSLRAAYERVLTVLDDEERMAAA